MMGSCSTWCLVLLMLSEHMHAGTLFMPSLCCCLFAVPDAAAVAASSLLSTVCTQVPLTRGAVEAVEPGE